MSHEIDFSNNRPAIAYAGRVPWHGLGAKIDSDASIEDWREAAGLNWHIEKRPLAFGIKTPAGEIVPRQYPKLYAHVRSDTQEPIGTGSDRFNLLQPGDVLEFYRDIVNATDFKIHTAGALKGGSRIWALAKWHGNINLGDSGRDRIEPYLLLATANDGTMSTVADLTTVCVVCQNTLSAAVGSNGNKAAIRVPHSRQFNADDVRAQLGVADDRFETFARDADILANEKISDDAAIEFFVDLIAKKNDAGEIQNERTVKNVTRELIQLYRRGPGADIETRRGTMWGAVNAVTHYADHKSRAHSAENRFDSASFGAQLLTKQLAFNRALEKVAA
jgi:phage/plasmid-like protein (TIGR03299 family)